MNALPMDAAPAGVFLGYQQRLLSTVSTHAVTVVEKSRRLGYSWAAAAIAALMAARGRAAGGMDVYYMGYNLEMAREFIAYTSDWAKGFDPAASAFGEFFFPDPDHPDKTIQAFRITFASGFSVVALPSVPRALRGMQGMVIIDEAAFHDNLEEVLKAAFALLIWGGKVVVISTHDGDGNPFNALVQSVRAGHKPYALLRCTFDDALADGLFRRICERAAKAWSAEAEAAWRAEIIAFYGDASEEELFCVPRAGGGAYFPMTLIEAGVEDVPVIRLEMSDAFAGMAPHLREAEIRDWCERELAAVMEMLDPDDRHHFGMDFGRSRDLSVLWPLAVTARLRRRTPFTVELRNTPFEQQRQILFYVADRLPHFSGGCMDAGGNGAYLAEVAWQRYGEGLIKRVNFTVGWYRDNMPPVKAAFEDQTFSVPRDRETLDDFRAVRVVGGVARVPEERRAEGGAKAKKRHGDAAIAGVLAYTASRLPVEEYGYTPALAQTNNPHHDDDPDTDDLGIAGFGSGAW